MHNFKPMAALALAVALALPGVHAAAATPADIQKNLERTNKKKSNHNNLFSAS